MAAPSEPSSAFEAMSQALEAATPAKAPLYWLGYHQHFQAPAITVAADILGPEAKTATDVDELLSATYAKGWEMGVAITAELTGIDPEVMLILLEVYHERGIRKPFTPAFLELLRGLDPDDLESTELLGELLRRRPEA